MTGRPWVQLLIRMRTANWWAGPRNADRPSYLSQARCVIVSGFTAALPLDTYPLRNLIRPRCAERAKPGRGNYKPVLIMHIGFLACFHAISLERSCFSENCHVNFLALVALKLLVSLMSRLVACSPRIVVDRQTDKQTNRQTHRTTTVTLAAHARRGLMKHLHN